VISISEIFGRDCLPERSTQGNWAIRIERAQDIAGIQVTFPRLLVQGIEDDVRDGVKSSYRITDEQANDDATAAKRVRKAQDRFDRN
jgi:hypothetical protein